MPGVPTRRSFSNALLCGVLSLHTGKTAPDKRNLLSRGFAIAEFTNGRFLLIDMIGKVHDLIPGKPRFLASSFGPDGSKVVGIGGNIVRVFDCDLRLVWSRPLSVPYAGGLTLSADGTRAALVTIAPGRGEKSIAQVFVLGSESEGGTVFEYPYDPRSENLLGMGWDPVGARLVFSEGSVVRILDIEKNESRKIADGFEPSWAPNGKLIGYRDAHGFGRVISLETGEDRAVTRLKITSRVHWSPDSEYFMVQERYEATRRPLECGDDRGLIVYRLDNGAQWKIYDTCLRRDIYFDWVSSSARWLAAARRITPARE